VGSRQWAVHSLPGQPPPNGGIADSVDMQDA